MPTKKTTKKADVWDEVVPVKSTVTPEKVAKTDDDDGSPFGSMTPIMKLIAGYRKEVIDNPITRNGRGTAPDGTVYIYYMSDDVLQHASQYCLSKQAFLDIGIYVNEHNSNIMRLSLIDCSTADEKFVEANLGNPQSTSDFGARITYAQKYLVGMMFGISVQTDSDAFNNGKKINHDTGHTNNGVDDTNSSGVVHSPNQLPSDNANSNSNSSAGVSANPTAGESGRVLEHSASYPTAKQFIERALNVSMLDTAESKVNTAKQLHDFEREELKELIAARRTELTKK